MASRTVTQADHGKTIDVAKGDSISIQLPENPTTGYRWKLDEHDPKALEPMQAAGFEVTSPAIGGGGGRTFRFVANAPGVSTVGMNLRRDWDDPKLTKGAFRVSFRVH